MKHVKLFEQFINEIVDLVHVYDKNGELFGTGELVKTKGKKSLIRWDGSNEEWIDSNLVKMVESAVSEKVSFTQMKKNSKTKEYKEVSNAIDGAEEVSDIWNMLDPEMFEFTEDEFEDIFHDWWNTQYYDSLRDFSRNGSFEDAHSLYLHLLPYLIESTVSEKREDVGKYNTVKKVIAKLGRRPSEQDLASFINNNYYDVTEVERGDDDPAANDKIADLVAFYKFDIDDWEIAWADAQNESVVTEAKEMKFTDFLEILDKKFTDAMSAVKGENGSDAEIKPTRGDILQNFTLFRNYVSSLTKKYKGDKTKLTFLTEKVSEYELVINELVVTESFRVGKVLAIKKYNVKTNRKEVVDVRVTDYIKKPGSKDFVEYDLKGKKRKVSVDVFKSMIAEDAVNVTPESDVTIDNYTTDGSEEILSVEIVGAIVSSESEDEFLQYFYDTYGEGAFTKADTSILTKYYNEYVEEVTAKETEEEEEAEKAEGGDDELDMDI